MANNYKMDENELEETKFISSKPGEHPFFHKKTDEKFLVENLFELNKNRHFAFFLKIIKNSKQIVIN